MLIRGVSVSQFCYVTLCTSNTKTGILRQFISIPQFNRATRNASPVVRFSWRCSWILRSSSVPKSRSWSNSLSRSLIGLQPNLTVASVRSTALRLTQYFGSAYLCEEAFSHMKIIKSRYRRRLTDGHLKCCLHLCLSNHSFIFYIFLMLTIPKCSHTYINYTVSVRHNKLYYRVFWAICFDSYRVIFRPFKNYIQVKMSLKMHCGIPNAYKCWGSHNAFLRSFYHGSNSGRAWRWLDRSRNTLPKKL